MSSMKPEHSIALTLAAHTNVGKTTLARTLLGRDVGEVRDAPHVTQLADRYTWLETPEGESLQLWDTPGFGDSQRLLKRMEKSNTRLGWFLGQVWDRVFDRGFFYTQKALRNVRDEADVVLYLVNATESPEAASYIDSEMKLLEWTEKPVIVLINQLGTEQDLEQEAADVRIWQTFLAQRYPHVFSVLPLDAFARCWVQEYPLLEAIRTSLKDGDRRELMTRLCAEWRADRIRTLDKSVDILATYLVRCAIARQPVEQAAGRLRKVLDGVLRRVDGPNAHKSAAQALSAQLRKDTKAVIDELVSYHGLEASIDKNIVDQLHQRVQPPTGLSEDKTTLVSAIVSGALTGLMADIMTGGLSLGGGLIVGTLAGAIGGRAAAVGYNRVYGTSASWIEWDANSLNELFAHAVLCYLLVAHVGRGRGKAVLQGEHPKWQQELPLAVNALREALDAIWSSRGQQAPDANAQKRIHDSLLPLVNRSIWAVLSALYPQALALRTPVV